MIKKLYLAKTKRTKHGIYHFFNNTYEFNLYVSFQSKQSVSDYFQLNLSSLDGAAASCISFDNGYIVNLPIENIKHCYIAHECLHGVNMVFSERRIVYDVLNDEPQCYLLGWFTKCVYEALEIERAFANGK